jgi:hypothetical protein
MCLLWEWLLQMRPPLILNRIPENPSFMGSTLAGEGSWGTCSRGLAWSKQAKRLVEIAQPGPRPVSNNGDGPWAGRKRHPLISALSQVGVFY